jgi:hypothetical protein
VLRGLLQTTFKPASTQRKAENQQQQAQRQCVMALEVKAQGAHTPGWVNCKHADGSVHQAKQPFSAKGVVTILQSALEPPADSHALFPTNMQCTPAAAAASVAGHPHLCATQRCVQQWGLGCHVRLEHLNCDILITPLYSVIYPGFA